MATSSLDRKALCRAVHEAATRRADSGPDTLGVLLMRDCEALARRFGGRPELVEEAALAAGVMPERYERNAFAFSIGEQLRLVRATAAMVGLGGLGGLVLEALARLGVGRIRGADGDVFEPSNLNRQLLCTHSTLRASKAEAAAARVAGLNPSVRFTAVGRDLTERDMAGFARGADVVLDCLGGLDCRDALERAAAAQNVPLVTGALAGWTGYVAVVLPGAPGPATLMGRGESAEQELGTQAPQVYAVASLMAAEAAKLICGQGSPLAGKMLVADFAAAEFTTMDLC